jgi:hypothetical protein
MKNSEDNNYGIRFKSKTEAIEQLCLKVFGAIPVYESSIEELKIEETIESMYAKVVSVALECDPIAAKDRADAKLEPPWEVFARVKRELAETQNLLKQCLSAMPVGYIPTHTAENLPEMIDDLAKALAEETTEREKLERECERARVERNMLVAVGKLLAEEYEDRRSQWGDEYLWKKWEHTDDVNAAIAIFNAAKCEGKTNIDNISCPECDALASHGSNDGPCETHKHKKYDNN